MLFRDCDWCWIDVQKNGRTDCRCVAAWKSLRKYNGCRLLGHTNTTTTQRYMHLDEDVRTKSGTTELPSISEEKRTNRGKSAVTDRANTGFEADCP